LCLAALTDHDGVQLKVVSDGRGQQSASSRSSLEMAGPTCRPHASVRSCAPVHRLDALRPQVSVGRIRRIEAGSEFGRAQTCPQQAGQVLHLDGLRGRGRNLAQVVRVFHGKRASARFAGIRLALFQLKKNY
jgi:hypothetical protein